MAAFLSHHTLAQVLIVPPRTIIPPGYRVVLENSKMCGGGAAWLAHCAPCCLF